MWKRVPTRWTKWRGSTKVFCLFCKLWKHNILHNKSTQKISKMIVKDNYCFDENRLAIVRNNNNGESFYPIKPAKNKDTIPSFELTKERILKAVNQSFSMDKHLPISAGFAMTNQCQLRCSYCINNCQQKVGSPAPVK